MAIPTNLVPLLLVAGLAAGQPVPADAPYVRLWTEVVSLEEATAANNLTGEALERRIGELTRWYGLFHSGWYTSSRLGDLTKGSSSTTLAEKLAARGAMVSNYRNGSYTMMQNEPGDLERSMPLSIATWWPGHKTAAEGSDQDPAARLAEAITPTEAIVQVVSAARYKPPKAPETWPYVASRGKGAAPGQARSLNTHDFVSWVRVGDEVMRVIAVTLRDGVVRLTVDRGYFGTQAAAHAKAARVMSPVYVGSTAASSGDVKFGGSPAVDNPNRALRYAMKVWTPEFIDFLARSIKQVFGNGRRAPYLQGINAGFLDITSCITYNQGDPYGYPVSMWDDPAGTVIQPAAQGRHQIEKVRGLRQRFGGASGYPALFWIANNVGGNGRIDACHNNLLSSGDFDGGMLENWLGAGTAFEANMRQHFEVQANDWPAIYFIKWTQQPKTRNPEQFRRYTYGAYLLGFNPAARRPKYGGTFGLAKPDEMFFRDWGPPVDRPSSLAEVPFEACSTAEGKPAKVYRRAFRNGTVLVNAGDEAVTCKPGGRPAAVSLAPRDAAFLMHSAK